MEKGKSGREKIGKMQTNGIGAEAMPHSERGFII